MANDLGSCLDGPIVPQFMLVARWLVEVVELLLDVRFFQAFGVDGVRIVPLFLEVELLFRVLHDEGRSSALSKSMFLPFCPLVVRKFQRFGDDPPVLNIESFSF